MNWIEGIVHGCAIRKLHLHEDERGWLSEIFRHDELESDAYPVMAYASLTHAGVTRGPHEHLHQTDLFAFLNGSFKLYLWDSRRESSTFGVRQVIKVGGNAPAAILVPPGVIHAYRNIGTSDALVINCPNQLYAGPQKMDPVDEIRWENHPNHNLILD